MKRSEMVRKLNKVAEISIYKDASFGDIGRIVLEEAEKLGMRPPVRENIEQHIDGVKYVEVEGWDEE